jgi:hypothetical protein
MDNREPGRTSMTALARELGLKPNAKKELQKNLRNENHRTTLALSEFQLGYESALNDLIDEARASSRTQELAPNARDDNRETENRLDEDEYYEVIEQAIQELVAEGRVYDTGERRWSERTQSYQVVWAAIPPKHQQH